MSTERGLPIAATKVIATGSAGKDFLRATVMLTPPYNNSSAADDAKLLSQWPSTVIQWLRSKEQNFYLRVRAEPVRYAGTDGRCVNLPQRDTSLVDVKVLVSAEAHAMAVAWKNRSSLKWVDELWASSFGAKRNDTQTWSLLGEAIALATSVSDDTLPAASSGMAGNSPQDRTDDPQIRADRSVESPDSTGSELEWILPSKQTDLSLLLEYNRALELCGSAKEACGEQENQRSKEVDYLNLAKRKKDRMLDLTEVCKAAAEHYSAALKSTTDLYQNKLCGPEKSYSSSNQKLPDDLDREDIEKRIQQPLDSYQAANPPQKQEGDYPPEDKKDYLARIFYSLQSSPTLSRLFGLTIDVRFPNDTVKDIMHDQQFLYLSLDESSLSPNRPGRKIFTFAKYRSTAPLQHFWPVTRAEVALGPSPEPDLLLNLSQYDGVTVGGRRLEKAKSGPRFELSSLDVRSACEAALDRQAIDLTERELRQRATESPLRPAEFARKTYLTAGLVMLDRGRQEQAISQFTARGVQQKNGQIVLDAEDLTIGYRIDVGVPLKPRNRNEPVDGCKLANDQRYAWRGVMARRVTYGVTGLHAQSVQAVAQKMFLENASPVPVDPELSWQKCLEDGFLALTSRLIPRVTGKGTTVLDAYVEEAIATWPGEPMGVTIVGKRECKVKPHELPCGRVVKAPTSSVDPTRRSSLLRFGWPYRIGLRSVYSGGISLPLGVAASLYDDGTPLGGSLTIPAAAPEPDRPRDQVRRFLRHERIDAPLLLLPEEVALRRNGAMGYESAARAVIRTVRGTVHDREHPTVTQRVFVAAGVSQSLAAMHSVFDLIGAEHPVEGLSSPRFGPYGARRDAGHGGFPVVTSDQIVGFNGFPYAASRRISVNTLGDKADTGDLVYSTAAPAKPRSDIPCYSPYYPDPAIKAYVIGIRIAGSGTYLSGKEPCIINAYGNGYGYPHTRPLVVTVQRAPAHHKRAGFPTLDELMTKPGSNGRVSGLPTSARRIPGAVEALITLAPGDDFEVDVWCVPDGAGLAQQFAVIESIGSLAVARAIKKSTPQTSSPPFAAEFCSALKDLLPSSVCQVIGDCLVEAGIAGKELCDWSEGCAGPGGFPAPGPKVLRAIGNALYDTLRLRPLDEIAAVRTLRVTHATDLPEHAPQFAAPVSTDIANCDGGANPSVLVKPDTEPTAGDTCPSAMLMEKSEKIGPDLPVSLCRNQTSKDEPYPYSATGDIKFDLPTTGYLEISADMASPSSDRFDDLRRARALRDRRLGTWPQLEDCSPIPASKIFGFDVSPAGEVTLPKTCGVVLYRLDDIPLPKPEGTARQDETCRIRADGDSHRVSLKELLHLRERNPSCGTGKFTFQFTDGLARSLDLRVTAYSRHRGQMRTASPLAHNGKWLRDGESLTAKDSSRQSSCISVWLDASVRPAEPAARTPIPAFLWSAEDHLQKTGTGKKKQAQRIRRLTRRMVIRIPLARPWFSSGEDERLGIVLWPPELFSQRPDRFQDDEITLNGRTLKLNDFYDEDLGPGGKFITRWGGDPTRFPAENLTSSTAPNPYRRSFIPASAFLDMREDTVTGFEAELFTNVSMPIRVEEHAARTDDRQGGDIPTLDVSLLTFKPKFDVFEEQWYVDVALEHEREAEPFVRLGLVRFQPHAPRHLQVSYPVIQWTQLLPCRTVEVRRSKTDVAIRVEGLATSPRMSVLKQSIPAETKERLPVTKMIARIVRESHLQLGVPARSVVSERIFGEDEISYSDAGDQVYRAVWERKMPLNITKDKSAKYFVIIEERDARLPATYASEPVSPQRALGKNCDDQFDDSLLLESGHRFIAKIEV